ncbi:MAG: DUF3524 domain-containing protein [Wenzhouxiangella sp.]|nr:MAG: DUF3524 domain-containing protein [Wenzhouxiangella sp.]
MGKTTLSLPERPLVQPVKLTVPSEPSRPARTILLLSAYRSDSHAWWADWLQRSFSHIDWQVLELPGRHFAWRIRGNPLSWLDRIPPAPPDLILASSMVDLATLRGLHPHLGQVPAIYYFHENQFAYPRSEHQLSTVEAAMVQIYGALAADRILFNSEYNRSSYMDGLQDLLARLPDHCPRGVVERLAARSAVLPVPVRAIKPGSERDPHLVLWNHRWEYDKDPSLFATALDALAESETEFRLALLGKRSATAPEALERIRQRHRQRIVIDGWLPRSAYCQWLGRAAIVVSTARHEFQGLSLLEAVSAGASPLVPDDLCYPEQYPSAHRYPVGCAQSLARKLKDWLEQAPPPRVNIDPWLEAQAGAAWQRVLR